VFGVRPENIVLAPREGVPQVALPAQVVISEPLGAETLVTFQVGQSELVARCAPDFKAPPGSSHTIYLDASALHLFNATTGQAL
jgi:multiple sugar transport system ATP-binding protein